MGIISAARTRMGTALAASLLLTSGLAAVTVAATTSPAAAASYPPPSTPTATAQKTEVSPNEDDQLCGVDFEADSTLQLTDDDNVVTNTVNTGATGKGCVVVTWSSDSATAKEKAGSNTSSLGRLGTAADFSLAAYTVRAASSDSVCHTMTFNGPDASGDAASASVQVCVSSSAGSSTGSGGGSLAFTGLDIALILITAVGLLGVGVGALGVARRPRPSA